MATLDLLDYFKPGYESYMDQEEEDEAGIPVGSRAGSGLDDRGYPTCSGSDVRGSVVAGDTTKESGEEIDLKHHQACPITEVVQPVA